jgi:hypothetical protein
VLAITTHIIRNGIPIAGTMNNQSGSPSAAMSQRVKLAAGSKRGRQGKTNWHAPAHHCPVDTHDAPISQVIELGITVPISNSGYLGGLAKLRPDVYRNYASLIRSDY